MFYVLFHPQLKNYQCDYYNKLIH